MHGEAVCGVLAVPAALTIAVWWSKFQWTEMKQTLSASMGVCWCDGHGGSAPSDPAVLLPHVLHVDPSTSAFSTCLVFSIDWVNGKRVAANGGFLSFQNQSLMLVCFGNVFHISRRSRKKNVKQENWFYLCSKLRAEDQALQTVFFLQSVALGGRMPEHCSCGQTEGRTTICLSGLPNWADGVISTFPMFGPGGMWLTRSHTQLQVSSISNHCCG